MLANGATLGIKNSASGASYTALPGLKEIPEIGVDPEKVENTTLTDTIKKYEMGIGDPGDMQYVFKFVNSAPTDAWRILRGYEQAGTLGYFKETLKDGTETTFSGYVALKRGGGGVNGVLDFTLAIALQSGLTITGASGATGVEERRITWKRWDSTQRS